jgi:hypothetical protein
MPTRAASDLDKVSKKWKAWLKAEYDWQVKVRAKLNKLWRDADNPGPPADLPPPPKPPFK